LVLRLFIILILLNGCRANLVPTSQTLDASTKNYTYDPQTIVCENNNGIVLNLTHETNSKNFCQIGRALISTASLFNLYVNRESNQAFNLFLHDSALKVDKSRRGRKLSTYAMGNPAILYCMQNKGEPIVYKESNRKIIICALEDGSEMSAWTLFNGPKNALEFANILNSEVPSTVAIQGK